MKKDNQEAKSETQTTDLRKQAEKIAGKTDAQENIEMMSPEERRMLLHELRVHQVELEMQNDELQRTQAQLNTQRERYFDLYDLAPVGYMTVSKQGLILEANLTVATLLGITKNTLSKALFTRFIIKEDQDIYYRHRKELFETGEPQTCELRMVKNDETYFWAHLEAIALQDVEGEPVCRIVLSDITERKLAEELLMENQAQLKEAHRLAHIGIWNWVAETDTVTWSEELYSIAGIDPSKLAPSYAEQSKIYAPESWKLLQEAVEQALTKSNQYQLELQLIRPDGTPRWVNAFGGLTYDSNGRNTGLHGTLQDITESKQTEDLLKVRVRLMEFAASHTLSETLQKTLDEVSEIVHSPIGFYHFVDSDQKTISLQEWSTRTVREFCTAQGRGSHYDVDKAGVWVDCLRQRRPIIHNDYASLPHRKGLPAGHAPVIRELVVPIMRDNLVVAILGVGNKPSEYTEKDLQVVEYLADVAWEIAARKHAEDENRSLQERLMRAEKMEALGLLAGGVAHDLNNVLGIVVGYAELLLDSVDEKSTLRKDLATIFDGGQKAAAIVDDLLTLARRGVVGKKVLNINKLISDFKKSPQWEKLLTYNPHIQISTDLDPDLLNISASSVHLEKTLYNLVSNAGEAMTSGGKITIKTSNMYIDKPIHGYDTINEGDYVVLSVSDEGDGISEKDLKRIFEPFYTKKIMGRSGTGLGLSVVWGTVKDHQGYIDVQSEEGKGTTFTLYFLITREEIPEEGLAVSTSEYQGNGQSILIVDDVKDQRDLAARLLTSLNYKVSNVSSGEEAIQYLKENKADLLVLDMIMDPGMDGLDTYKSILEINPKQKAIIVSGFSESDRVKEAKALGAGAYIKKPYIKEKLGLAVKKELGNER